MEDKSLKNKIRNAVDNLNGHIKIDEEEGVSINFNKEDFIEMLMNDKYAMNNEIKDIISNSIGRKNEILYILYKITGNLYEIYNGIDNKCLLEYKYGELLSYILQLSLNIYIDKKI